MKHATRKARRFPRISVLALAIAVGIGGAYAVPAAQTAPQAAAPAQVGAKKALTIADYSRWRTITGQQLSGDGKWAVYGVAFTNVPTAETKPVLTILNLENNQKVEITDGSAAAFSTDSMWIAYTVDPSAGGRGGRGGRGGGGGAGAAPGGGAPAQTPTPSPTPSTTPSPSTTPQAGRGAETPPAPPRRVELRSLANGTVGPVARQWQDIQSFSFSPTATHLLLRRRPAAAAGAGAGRAGGDPTAPTPAPAAGAAAPAAPAGPRGVDVTIHDLKNGRDQLLGSVADSSFNKAGDFLAYTVDAAVKDTNGLFVFDLPGGRVVPLENDAKLYNRLVWNEGGTSLAVLKGLDVDKMRERNNVLVVYPNVRAFVGASGPAPQPVTLDPAKSGGFPKDWVVSDRAAVSFSDDSTRVYFGIKEQVAVPEAKRPNRDEIPDVDVWTTRDERVQSLQMARADAERNFTFRSAMVVSTGAFVKLTDATMREIDVALTGQWAVGRDTRGQIRDYGDATADLYRVNTMTGERTLMMKAAALNGNPGLSPNGRQYLYWKDGKFQAWDLESGATRAIGGAVSFVNVEDDHPGTKPPYPIAQYTKDGTAAIAQQRYDLWLVPFDGSAPRNITNGYGTKNEVRLRIFQLIPNDPLADYGPGGIAAVQRTVDLSKPVALTAYGEWTKKAGFFELNGGQLKELIYEDASFSNPQRAAKAERFLFTRQTFIEYPDLRVSGADFKVSTKISDANPQQAEYLWGRRILFDYKNKAGVRLQGILAIPDDYKAGEKRPMLVTFYEKNSQNLHRYNAPSYLSGMGSSPMQAVTEGYLTMLADVYYNTGSSHSDQLDCVEAATRKVIELGYADPKRIGVNGHSYGGEGAAFIGTRSKMFAAVGVGAGVSDLYSDFTQSWGWTYLVSGGSGANAFDYYMEGQGRWGFSPWDNPEVYHFESALTHVRETVAPILIMHGTADPTVSFVEGLNFYSALRFNKKNAALLAYPGEGHGLTGLANRRDLTVRYFEFFNHYLKGAPAPKWLTDGVPFLEKGK